MGATGPTAEERRQRAEHLRTQRERLLSRRSDERARKIHEFQGASRPIHDDTPIEERVSAGRRLVAELTPGAVVASEVDPPVQNAPEVANAMRQALTLQLRQTLVRSTGDRPT